jgi:hypothetical protein
MEFVNNFPSTYVVDVDPDWPDRGEEVIPSIAYNRLGYQSGKFRDIRFYPQKGGSWIGQFETGQIIACGDFVFSVPNPSLACVITSGAGYWVDVEDRKVTRIELREPITQASISTKHSLILFTTFRDLYAYSSSNLVWSQCDLASDDLKIIKIDQDTLTVEGFEMGSMMEMHINLWTGDPIDEWKEK